MFYLNSNLNFGIPSVLIFQLEVYYKVDRLLIGSRDSSSSESSPERKRKRSNTPIKERLGSRSTNPSRNRSRDSGSSRSVARRRRSRSTFGRSPSVSRTSRHPKYKRSKAFNDGYHAPRPRRSFSRVADETDPPPSRRRLASSKTSTPLDKKETFEFDKKKPDESSDDSDIKEIPIEEPADKKLSKADKKKKLSDKTRSFREFLEKSVEREVILIGFLLSIRSMFRIQKVDNDCLGIKEEPSWTVIMYEPILSKVSECMKNSMKRSLLLHPIPICQLIVVYIFLVLTLFFQADRIQQNQHKRWLLVNCNFCICAYADIALV